MKKQIIKEGFVAKYNNQFWGIQYSDGDSTSYDFGDIENATISDSQYCKKPTDMTYNNGSYNPCYEKLSKAILVKVRKITTIEIEEIE